jgi:hypothetical protein
MRISRTNFRLREHSIEYDTKPITAAVSARLLVRPDEQRDKRARNQYQLDERSTAAKGQRL